MPTLHQHIKTTRNRLRRNYTDLDRALALAELHRLPPSHIQTIRRALATTKRLQKTLSRLVYRTRPTDQPPLLDQN